MSERQEKAAQTPNRRFVYLLNVAQRRLQRWSESRPDGATAAQAGVLFTVDTEAGVLIGDIARSLGAGPSGISGLVDRMEAADLVRRASDPEDGRAVRLFLTEKGLAARNVAKTRAAAMNARLVEGFSVRELDIVARWLSQVDQRFKED
jgi:DNA-binding MarR family transcriptional regulator